MELSKDLLILTCSIEHFWCGRLRILQFSGFYWKCLHTFTEWVHRLSIIDGTVDMITINTTFLWGGRRLFLLSGNRLIGIWDTVTWFCCRFWLAFLLFVLMVIKDLKKKKKTKEKEDPRQSREVTPATQRQPMLPISHLLFQKLNTIFICQTTD